MNVTMNYNGSTLNVTITDLDTDASASQSYSVNIPAVVGSQNAFVGFTGGNGRTDLHPGDPQLDLHAGADHQYRRVRIDQRFRRPHLGLVLCRDEWQPRDQL